jgi:hypothetical protein
MKASRPPAGSHVFFLEPFAIFRSKPIVSDTLIEYLFRAPENYSAWFKSLEFRYNGMSHLERIAGPGVGWRGAGANGGEK